MISEETREKHRQNALKQKNRVNPPIGVNSGSFKKGITPWNKGKKFMSESHRQAVIAANKRRARA